MPGLSAHDIAALRSVIDQAVFSGAKAPLIFATVVVSAGAMLSFLIPQVGPRGSRRSWPTAGISWTGSRRIELLGVAAAMPTSYSR